MNKSFSNILDAVNKIKSGSFNNDDKDKYWNCEVDKAGNGMAVIRFLPAKTDDGLPFVRKFTHAFKHGSKWFIEPCLTTIGEDCPVCNANSELWDTGTKENQEIVRKRKRKQSFISNILVISDPKNPDNEGKVFLFKYGKKIFAKIMDSLEPEFSDETPVNPFDAQTGADFTLKIRQVEGYANYDKSTFATPSDRSKEINKLLDSIDDLQDLISPDKFKSFAEQQKKLMSVIGSVAPKQNDDDDEAFMKKAVESNPVQKPASVDDDDDFSQFQKLVDSDDDLPF